MTPKDQRSLNESIFKAMRNFIKNKDQEGPEPLRSIFKKYGYAYHGSKTGVDHTYKKGNDTFVHDSEGWMHNPSTTEHGARMDMMGYHDEDEGKSLDSYLKKHEYLMKKHKS